MREKLILVAALPVALVALFGGCAGTETGNPTLPATELRLAAISDDFDSVAVGRKGPGISIERAGVGLQEVELLGCDGASSLAFETADAELTLKPSLVLTAQGAAAEYCGARLTLEPSSELGASSVLVEGTRADGTPIAIASDLALTIELVTNPPNTPFPAEKLILAFNFATWLEGVDVDGASVENGLVSIDQSHNPDVLAAFDARAHLAPALYDDPDGNGLLMGDNQPPAAGPP